MRKIHSDGVKTPLGIEKSPQISPFPYFGLPLEVQMTGNSRRHIGEIILITAKILCHLHEQTKAMLARVSDGQIREDGRCEVPYGRDGSC